MYRSKISVQGKFYFIIFIVISLLLLFIAVFWSVRAQSVAKINVPENIPGMLNYQGMLKSNGQAFNGVGYFKFAIVDSITGNGTQNYWANDGTTLGQPANCIALTVSNGLFNVNLGDTSVPGISQVISSTVFTHPITYLRVWFNPSNIGSFTALEPNQRIVSSAYSMNSDRLGGQSSAYYLNASNISSGSLSNSLFSAYSDLSAEGNIGSGSNQLASGDHTHSGQSWNYSGSIGLEVSNSALNGTGLRGSSQGSGGIGVQGYVSGTGGKYGVYGFADIGSGKTAGVLGRADSSEGAGVVAYNFQSGAGLAAYSWGGNIIEGWQGVYDDSTKLVFKVDNEGDVYSDRAFHCGVNDGGDDNYIDENGGCVYDNDPADFAEVLEVDDEASAGDVLVVNLEGELTRSTKPYQKTVVGVYSTSPSYVGGAENLGKAGYVPLAVVGLVPVKVSCENGAIQPGDLLVTSATAGYAMKASNNPPIGTVIGKAMGSLAKGKDVILMLVMLQ